MDEDLYMRRISHLRECDFVYTKVAWALTILCLALYQFDLSNIPIMSEFEYENMTPIMIAITMLAIGAWVSNKINLDTEIRELRSKKKKEDLRE